MLNRIHLEWSGLCLCIRVRVCPVNLGKTWVLYILAYMSTLFILFSVSEILGVKCHLLCKFKEHPSVCSETILQRSVCCKNEADEVAVSTWLQPTLRYALNIMWAPWISQTPMGICGLDKENIKYQGEKNNVQTACSFHWALILFLGILCAQHTSSFILENTSPCVMRLCHFWSMTESKSLLHRRKYSETRQARMSQSSSSGFLGVS